MCASHHAFKDTLHCAHIPSNIVPKGARPQAQLESLGRGRDSLAKKTGDGVGEAARGESSLPVKDQPSVARPASGRPASGGVGAEGGAAAGGMGALHLIQVQQSLVQHPLCAQVLLFGAFQLI